MSTKAKLMSKISQAANAHRLQNEAELHARLEAREEYKQARASVSGLVNEALEKIAAAAAEGAYRFTFPITIKRTNDDPAALWANGLGRAHGLIARLTDGELGFAAHLGQPEFLHGFEKGAFVKVALTYPVFVSWISVECEHANGAGLVPQPESPR